MRVEPLPSAYQAGGFRCEAPGVPNDHIGAYLAEGTAAAHQAMGISRTYLVFEAEAPTSPTTLPMAYFTLQADAVQRDAREQLPGVAISSIPAIKVTRLGVRDDWRRRGVGGDLLKFIEVIAIDLGRVIGVRYLTLDAVADKVSWYEKQGFHRTLVEQPTAEQDLDDGDCSMWKDIGALANRAEITVGPVVTHLR